LSVATLSMKLQFLCRTVTEVREKIAGIRHEAALKEADEGRWLNATNCFVRYGLLPADGRSKNGSTGTVEEGISVFRGQQLPTGEARALPHSNEELRTFCSVRDRPLFIANGVEVGKGSDGEPLLAGCRIRPARSTTGAAATNREET
jgi:hypothetical protein